MNLNKILIQIDRICGWLLIPFMILFYISGFALVGKYSFNKLIDPNKAMMLHSVLTMPTFFCFIVHVGIRIFFTIKRWKKNRKK